MPGEDRAIHAARVGIEGDPFNRIDTDIVTVVTSIVSRQRRGCGEDCGLFWTITRPPAGDIFTDVQFGCVVAKNRQGFVCRNIDTPRRCADILFELVLYAEMP